LRRHQGDTLQDVSGYGKGTLTGPHGGPS
jgi:hypothetical protein